MEIDPNGLAKAAEEERDEESLHNGWSLQALPPRHSAVRRAAVSVWFCLSMWHSAHYDRLRLRGDM